MYILLLKLLYSDTHSEHNNEKAYSDHDTLNNREACCYVNEEILVAKTVKDNKENFSQTRKAYYGIWA